MNHLYFQVQKNNYFILLQTRIFFSLNWWKITLTVEIIKWKLKNSSVYDIIWMNCTVFGVTVCFCNFFDVNNKVHCNFLGWKKLFFVHKVCAWKIEWIMNLISVILSSKKANWKINCGCVFAALCIKEILKINFEIFRRLFIDWSK